MKEKELEVAVRFPTAEEVSAAREFVSDWFDA